MTKEVLTLALEALETSMYPQQKQLQAITAIKEALAQPERSMKVEGPLHVVCQCNKCNTQPEQEPVAWVTKTGSVWKTKADETDTPLYTTPPQRKPLTDDEIETLFNATPAKRDSWKAFARAIEASHNIKENT